MGSDAEFVNTCHMCKSAVPPPAAKHVVAERRVGEGVQISNVCVRGLAPTSFPFANFSFSHQRIWVRGCKVQV